MFALVIALVAVVAHFPAGINHDRSGSTPRSHWHELDRHSAVTIRVV